MLGREIAPLAEEATPTSMAHPHLNYTLLKRLVKDFESGRIGVWKRNHSLNLRQEGHGKIQKVLSVASSSSGEWR